MKKHFVAASIVVAAVAAHAQPLARLSNLADLEGALNRGAAVSVTVDLSKCTPAGNTTAPSSTRGGLTIRAYRIVADGTLSFADEHATVDSQGQPIWQFIRYRVKPDQTVSFSTDMFSLPSYTRLLPQIQYACAIDRGVVFYTERR